MSDINIIILLSSRGLVKVGFCRFPQDEEKKLQLLSDLKDAVAEFNLEFKDSHQKVSRLSQFSPIN